jgi:hypothetical protein
MAIGRKVLNMTVDERQVALTVMDHLRDDLKTAKTRDGMIRSEVSVLSCPIHARARRLCGSPAAIE